jgi:hypothetical protein
MEKKANGEVKALVSQEKCNGAIKCPRGAITLKCVRPEDHVPKGLAIRDGETRDEPRYDKYRKID